LDITRPGPPSFGGGHQHASSRSTPTIDACTARGAKLQQPGGSPISDENAYGSIRYIVRDVRASLDFYTTHFGFAVASHPAPAFADVRRGSLRLLLSGPGSSGARATPDLADGPGRLRIHLLVDNLPGEIARLRSAGVLLLGDIVTGPGGQQVLVADPDGNLVELFEPAR
jgi:catechol 2,3-dioxygenase-like lactoylglutathione lyase family enzyme